VLVCSVALGIVQVLPTNTGKGWRAGKRGRSRGLTNGWGPFGQARHSTKRTICAARAVRGAIQVFRDVIARKATPTMVPQPKILSGIAGLRAMERRG
jgi:hypothetical protein